MEGGDVVKTTREILTELGVCSHEFIIPRHAYILCRFLLLRPNSIRKFR